MTLAAIDPDRNAVVHAAAGTGKTWLLVSRVLRLLLQGAKPSSILAITFTRKAAAEMRLRVNERLLAMCEASDAELAALLEQIGLPPEAGLASRARRLYESLLTSPQELRATTFHAFCQELLARFAFEAGVPPAFELEEQTAELEAAAWRALDGDLARGDPAISNAMDQLLNATGGLENTRKALRDFLAHRSDWWAYTENEPDPVAYATARLQAALAIDPAEDPLADFAQSAAVRSLVVSLHAGIARDTPASLTALRDALSTALQAPTPADFHRLLRQALYTNEGEPRAFRLPNEFAKRLGAASCDEILRARDGLLDRFAQVTERCRRHATWQRSRHWYTVGARLLAHFQAHKRSEGVLDFADLEWCAYRLLNEGRHAEWVQYKLDQRIDHLLVDEFQDTNPTQWRLLLPLLREMAAGTPERRRSVFLVGDEKQSIYRFRRADPELFTLARDWLADQTGAAVYDQHISWRSSPAVVRFVNLLFDTATPSGSATDGDHTLKNFRAHETHRQELWGHAELLPLIRRDPRDAAAPDFRDPLEQPRVSEEDKRREREGELVAAKIQSLIGRPIYRKREIHPARYGDIMILLRNRTHAAAYEAALRNAGIPYIGAGRGTFLDCLEVRDIVALLRLLVSPWENLALATVLRSPIFAASDEDLRRLAAVDAGGGWYDRLLALAADPHQPDSLTRAARLLSDWRRLADRIPVHDLLDRIYFDAAVPERYDSAAPAHLRARVAANLTRLLDLALDADGGRFPSLARFLSRLEILTEDDRETVGAQAAGDQVRLLTVHAAKGLESPIVFLVDAARATNGEERGVQPLVEWPIADARPSAFLLMGRKQEADSYTSALLAHATARAFQEESNLLYVALTRAQQWLFVSGCESGPRRGNGVTPAGDSTRGWYGYIERRFQAARDGAARERLELQLRPIAEGDATINLCGFISHGLPPALAPAPPAVARDAVIDTALTRPFDITTPEPDAATDADDPLAPADLALVSAAKQRGTLIHRALERLTDSGVTRVQAQQRLWREFAGTFDDALLTECWKEACDLLDAPHLRGYFDPACYRAARNEVAVVYDRAGRTVTGVIDRLIVHDDRLVLIDYKTHRASPAELPALAERYRPQLRLYAEGLRQLWPGRPLEAILLFTSSRTAIPLDL